MSQGHRSYPRVVNGDSLLARLAEAPDRAAILLDVDGCSRRSSTAAGAAVPEETRAELRRLDERYALVACISGRRARTPAASSEWTSSSRSASTGSSWSRGGRLERTTATFARRSLGRGRAQAADGRLPLPACGGRSEALRMLEAVADAGAPRRSRRSLRPEGAGAAPAGRRDKGTAVAHLLGERGLERALYAATTRPTSTPSTRCADSSSESRSRSPLPEGPAELREAADVVVDGPPAMLELLRSL